jgi:hypothetical protein
MRLTILTVAVLSAVSAWTQAPAGRWEGTIVYGKLKVPFTIHFDGSGAAVTGALVNGEKRVSSTSGNFDGKQLQLAVAGKTLKATLEDGGLKGTFDSQPFTASAYCTCGLEGVAGPAIMGVWEIPDSGWRLDVDRKGEDTLVTISRPGESIGPVTGRYDGLTFQLHYFDGTRAAVLEIEERKDGALDIVWMEPGREALKSKAIRVNR